MTSSGPEDPQEDPVVVEAILNIQMAIHHIVPFANQTGWLPGQHEELNAAVADLEQAVRFLKGEEDPS
jgi:hypothetical protein